MNKKLLTVAIAGAMATPMAAQAVKYSLSGQVNRAIVFQDDGTDSQVRNVDSISSGTRFRLRGSEDLGNGTQVGFYWELQTSSNPSSTQNPQQNGETVDGGNSGALRQANVWFSGNWGKLTLGQTDGAGNGATESDLSGTGVVQGHYMNSYTGGMQWRTANGATTGLTSGDTWNEFDAFSRYDAIRYDTPALGPVSLAASVGNASRWEVAGRVDADMMGGKLSGALFYGQDHGRTASDVDRYGGSLSFLFAQGTSITGAYARNEQDVSGGLDSDVWSVKLGHKWGPHAVSATFGIGDEIAERDGEHTTFGVAYVHSLKKANTEIYGAFAYEEYDRPSGAASVDEHYAVVVGARVRFD